MSYWMGQIEPVPPVPQPPPGANPGDVIPGLPNPNPNDPPLNLPAPGFPGFPGGPVPNGNMQAEQAAVMAIQQGYPQLSPASQAQVYQTVIASGGGAEAYGKDKMKAAAVGAVAGGLLGYVLAKSMR